MNPVAMCCAGGTLSTAESCAICALSSASSAGTLVRNVICVLKSVSSAAELVSDLAKAFTSALSSRMVSACTNSLRSLLFAAGPSSSPHLLTVPSAVQTRPSFNTANASLRSRSLVPTPTRMTASCLLQAWGLGESSKRELSASALWCTVAHVNTTLHHGGVGWEWGGGGGGGVAERT